MSYLYVNEQGSKLGISDGYFIVTQKDGVVRKIPKETLESVIIFGNIQMSTQFMAEVLSKGIPVSIFSTKGKYFGRVESTSHHNIEIIKSQISAVESRNYSLELSKRIISAKIHNQKVLLRRYNRDVNIVNEKISRLTSIEKAIERCETIPGLMGYEGAAAKTYFQGLSLLVPKEFSFSGRNRRPPKDPFNSMLSLGYTLLMYEIYGVIVSRGMNAYAGFLHQDRRSHPTLASDLMEEWRAIIVDSLVMSLITGREISRESFTKDESTGGIYISNEGMKIFLNKFEKKLRTESKYREDSSGSSFRKVMWLQSGDLLDSFRKQEVTLYEPIKIR